MILSFVRVLQQSIDDNCVEIVKCLVWRGKGVDCYLCRRSISGESEKEHENIPMSY
jgi:hypothetical protein